MTPTRSTPLRSTLRAMFTDPDVRNYRAHPQDTDRQLAALDDHALDRLYTGARRAQAASSRPTERTRIEAFVVHLERLMRDRAAGRPAPVAGDDPLTADLATLARWADPGECEWMDGPGSCCLTHESDARPAYGEAVPCAGVDTFEYAGRGALVCTLRTLADRLP